MRCTNCGCELPEGAKFCFSCGAKQPEVTAAPEPAANETEPTEPAADETKPEEPAANETKPEEPAANEKEPEEPAANETKPEEPAANETEPTEPAVNETEPTEPDQEPEIQAEPEPQNTTLEDTPAGDKFCPYCGTKNEADAVFCFSCGKNMEMEKMPPAVPPIPPEAMQSAAPKKKLPVKWLAAAAVIVVVVVVGIKVAGGRSRGSNAYVAYLKDGRVSQADLDHYKREPVEYSGSYGGEGIYEGRGNAETCYSEDGAYIFYPTNVEFGENGQEYTLNMQKTGKSEGGVKIDSFVCRYTVLKNNKVVYIKSGSNTLYLNDIKDNKEKIASDVLQYYIDEKEDNIVWTEKAGADKISVYQQELSLKKEKKKLADDVGMVLVGNDLRQITVMDEDTLYLIEDFKDKEKISSGVQSVVSNNDECVYYIKEAENKLMASDLVEDDCAKQDQEITEPEYEDFKIEKVEKNHYSGKYEKTETTDYDAYNEAYDKYRAKLNRDDMRSELDEYEISNQTRELYRYKDGKEEMMDSAFADLYSFSQTEALLFNHYNLEDIPKVRLSDLEYLGDVESQYYESLVKSVETCVCTEGEVVVLDEVLTEALTVDEDGQKGYGLKVERSEEDEDSGDKGRKTLMSFTVGSKADGKCEVISEDVDHIETVHEGKVYYMSDMKDNSGVLYCDEEEIDSDVQSYTLDFVDDTVFYAVDFSRSRQSAMLKKYDGKKSVLIADDVYQYKAFEPDKVALLTDYSVEAYRGSLEFYRGKEELIDLDEDVRYLFGGSRISY